MNTLQEAKAEHACGDSHKNVWIYGPQILPIRGWLLFFVYLCFLSLLQLTFNNEERTIFKN